jgi:molybdopterin-guanine dinucleotide biosynthesis protein A
VRVADRALAALAEASDEQLVVANDARAAEWFPGRRIVPDAVPGLGPLAGLRAGLEAADGAAMLVIAWDMPFVPGGLLCALREAGEATAADAAVPVHPPGETPEPVCAYYAPAALHLCRALLAGGERRAAAVYENLGTVHRLEGEALRRFGDPARLFTSIDTPAALAAAGGVLDASGV